MVGGIFYEHGHRMIASTVGFLTIILAVWTWRVDPRRWVRRLGFIALGAVILQGLLGGITVLFLLPAPISIGHAGLAQIFFCLTVSLALFTSPGWLTRAARRSTIRCCAASRSRRRCWSTARSCSARRCGTSDAGLAIPDFPWAFGRVLPPAWNAGIAIHFAHRVGALVVTLAILATAGHVWYHHRSRPRAVAAGDAARAASSSMQVTLGAFVDLDRAPAAHQHRARRQRRAGAGDVAGADAAELRCRSRIDAAPAAERGAQSPRERESGRGPIGIRNAVRQAPNQLGDSSRDRGAPIGRRSPSAVPSRAADFVALAKPRLNLLVVVSAVAGYVMAQRRHARRVAAALHGRRHRARRRRRVGVQPGHRARPDALMQRTRMRPMPDGRLAPRDALVVRRGARRSPACCCSPSAPTCSARVVALRDARSATPLVYTPLKRQSSFATVIGAIPGALPPVIGWAAALDELSRGAWVLFGIIFLWQLPHFLAIAWIYREDYARAGLPDAAGASSPTAAAPARQAVIYAAALAPGEPRADARRHDRHGLLRRRARAGLAFVGSPCSSADAGRCATRAACSSGRSSTCRCCGC